MTMKRILSIITAGCLALLAFSCAKVEEKAVVDISKATAPVLQSFTAEDDIVVTYTPAVFTMGFNEKMATYHTLAMVSVEGKASNVTLSTKNDGSHLTLTRKTLVNALKVRGFEPLDVVSVELVVRGAIQNPSEGITNAFVDSEGKATVSVEMPEDAVGCPYEEYTEDSNWSVIGALSAYGINWDGDLNMWTDGNGNYVAPHVVLKAADEVKFRQDLAWTVNVGGEFGGLDAEFAVAQDGANIKVGADGVYDLYYFSGTGTALVTAAFDPYPEFVEESNWSVIGKLTNYGIEWNNDIPMVSDGSVSAAFGVSLTADDEFKFRQDKAWTVNLGGEFGGLDADFAVAQDGANIKVGAAGVYDLFVDPANMTAKIATPSGLKISSVIGGDEPEPEPEPVEVKGWNIIGLNGDWDNDVLASEKDGVWTAYITAEAATDFKWRKDGSWDDGDYGMSKDEGYTFIMGTAFPAVAGGANIPVAAGFYKVVLDLTDAETPTITVYDDFEVWSLIGDFNSWAGDVDMTLAEGKWVSPVTKLNTNGFKIRKNHAWTTSYGGVFNALGEAFDATTTDGNNIMLEEEGEYIVTFDPENLKITVDPALPSNTWSVIGVNGDWNTDIFMTEMMPGIWVSPKITVESGDWKVRFNHGWDVNRGGALDTEGVFAKAVPGGDNIKLTGEFQVVYNANNETIGTLVWGVVGKVASINGFDWNMDVPMNLASDGNWYSLPITLAEGDQIKVRKYAAWDENFGGTFSEADMPFDVVNNGDNITAQGTYVVVFNPTASTITLSTNFWGVIGDFNTWGGDKFMLYDGANWVAYGQTLAGGWKLRKSAAWDVNRGGTFTEVGTAFDVVNNGDNINVGELENFDIVYNPEAETITIQ